MSTKTFTVNKNTPIGFGKHKGKPHGDLLLPENKSYAKWVIDQTDQFRYSSTRDFIIQNLKNVVNELTPSEWLKLTSLERELTEDEQKSVDHFNDFLLRIDKTEEEAEPILDGEEDENE